MELLAYLHAEMPRIKPGLLPTSNKKEEVRLLWPQWPFPKHGARLYTSSFLVTRMKIGKMGAHLCQQPSQRQLLQWPAERQQLER